MTRSLPLAILLIALAAQTSVGDDPSLDLPVAPEAWKNFQAKQGQKGKRPEAPKDPLPPPRPEYVPLFGEPVPVGDSVVFVIDRSSSMTCWMDGQGGETRWEVLQHEIAKAVNALDETQKFALIDFTCITWPLWSELRPATAKNKAEAISWLMAREPRSSTGTGPAVVAALSLGPDSVILLTDGDPNCGLQPGEHRDLIRRMNRGTRIDVIGIGVISQTRAWCQQIACQNNGTYMDVR